MQTSRHSCSPGTETGLISGIGDRSRIIGICRLRAFVKEPVFLRHRTVSSSGTFFKTENLNSKSLRMSMNTRKILKDALKGCDREEVAKFVGISLGSLNNQIAGEMPYAPKGKTPNLLDRVCLLIDIIHETTGNALILEKLAEEWGYLLIENPAITTTETPAIQHIAAILKEFAHVIDEISQANADGKIELSEAERIRAKWEIMKRVTEEFVIACETGRYNRREDDHA
nr:MAG TPA: regulatory protein [Caudoviricetes sp.]